MKQKLQFHSTSVKQIVDITVPMMIDQLFLVGFNFINTFMISSSGETAISAVNMVGILNVFFAQISSAVELAATVLIAQWSVQKSKRDKLGMLSRQAILTNLGINVTLAVVLLASHQALLGLLFGQVDPELIRLSSLLFVGMILCYPLQSIVDGINGSLRGITKTKHSLMVSLSMNVMYLLGNVVLLTVFHLEILGLAISLVCSRICGVMIATLVYRRQSLFKDAVTGMQKWALQKRFVGLVAFHLL